MNENVKRIYDNYIKEKHAYLLDSKDDFINTISSNEILVIILKGHLYIENALLELLSEIIDLELVNSDMSFKQKLDLAYSLGLILDETYRPLNKFNKIRNQYMHKINYCFNEKEFNDLLSTFSKEYKDTFYKISKQDGHNELKTNFLTNTIMLIYEMWSNILIHKVLAIESVNTKLKGKQFGILCDYVAKEGGTESAIQEIINEFDSLFIATDTKN